MNREYFTIPGFEKLSKQELFDMSARHILTTRTKSTNEAGSCVYTGTGCAASVFLRAECRKKADNCAAGDSSDWHSLREANLVPSVNVVFVYRLQRCHDGCSYDPTTFVGEWKQCMRELAEEYDLSAHLIDEDDKKCSD